jgi:hypothetical protein
MPMEENMKLSAKTQALLAEYGSGIPVSLDALGAWKYETAYRLYVHPYGGAFIVETNPDSGARLHSSWDANMQRRADPFPLLQSYVEWQRCTRAAKDAAMTAQQRAAEYWHAFTHLVWRVPAAAVGLVLAGITLWAWFSATDSSLIQHLYSDSATSVTWQFAAALSSGMIVAAGYVAYIGMFPMHAWHHIRSVFLR